jgi:hypothetical protein
VDPNSPVAAYQALGHVWIVPLLVALCGMALVTGLLVIDTLTPIGTDIWHQSD